MIFALAASGYACGKWCFARWFWVLFVKDFRLGGGRVCLRQVMVCSLVLDFVFK